MFNNKNEIKARETSPEVIERLKKVRFEVSDHEKDLCECMHKVVQLGGPCEICGQPIPFSAPMPGIGNTKAMIDYQKTHNSDEFSDDELKGLALMNTKLAKFIAKYCSINGYINPVDSMPRYAGQTIPFHPMMGPVNPMNQMPLPPVGFNSFKPVPIPDMSPLMSRTDKQAFELAKGPKCPRLFRFNEIDDEEDMEDFLAMDGDKFIVVFYGFSEECVKEVIDRNIHGNFDATYTRLPESSTTEVVLLRKTATEETDPDDKKPAIEFDDTAEDQENKSDKLQTIEFMDGDDIKKLQECVQDKFYIIFKDMKDSLAREFVRQAALVDYKRRYRIDGSDVYVTLTRRK